MTVTHPPASFSTRLRDRTSGDHRSAERSPFLGALVSGELPVAGYVDMLAQHHHAYGVLEGAPPDLLGRRDVAPFLHPGLARLPSLAADLSDLAGADWAASNPPTAATQAYVERLRSAWSWPGGYVAHHYARYLGDLSGGQYIGRVAAEAYGLTPTHGGRFARFDAIGDHDEFKAGYRQALDEAPWDEAEQERVIDEIRQAYRLNSAVFVDLEHHVS